MRVKTDFITNSSSSSFLVLTKGNSTKERLSEIFTRLMGDCKLFPNLPRNIADAFHENMSKQELGEWLDENDYETLNDESDNPFFTTVKENYGEYPFIYSGFFSDEDGHIESLLCESSIDYQDDDIIIYKEGGY